MTGYRPRIRYHLLFIGMIILMILTPVTGSPWGGADQDTSPAWGTPVSGGEGVRSHPGQDPESSIPARVESGSRLYAPASLLVWFDPRSDTLPMRTHAVIGSRTIHDYSAEGAPGLELVEPPDKMTVEQAVEYYGNQPGVLYAEPDYYRFASRIPSDPDFWRQWGLSNTGQVYREGTPAGTSGADINAIPAWDAGTGGETIVAVLDSGVDYLHPDLISSIIGDPVNGTAGYDAITGDLEAMDLGSHGTHCAGTIGAVGENGLGISGINWQTRILPVRFLNSFGRGTVSDGIEAILWATDHGAEIISCSYGGTTYSRAEYEVMKRADALFICAAGNSANNNDITPFYPCSLDIPNIISVAATDSSDNLADFSNYGGTSVDIAAPGVDIYSTKHNTYTPDPRWTDPFDSFTNWTTAGNWTLNTDEYVSPASSATATVNRSAGGQSAGPAVLTIREPFNLTGISNPILSYEWSLIAFNYTFSVEGSANGRTWHQLEYIDGNSMLAWILFRRECKIPMDLRGGDLYIRFITDGDLCNMGLDDVTLSDGYGELSETRWGYMEGTSMAAPHVSGMATFLLNIAPDASLPEVRDAILATARPVPSHSGKTATGGVADLSAAVELITGGSAHHLKIQPGWNHVSVPYRLREGNNTAEQVFGALSNLSGHSLYRYDAGGWTTVGAGEVIHPLSSYWVFTPDPASLPLITDQNQSGVFTRTMTTGWNGFGVVGGASLPAKEELAPLSDIWSYVIGYNGSTQQSEEPIIRGGGGYQNESGLLSPYRGYWVYLTRNATYEKNMTGEAGEGSLPVR